MSDLQRIRRRLAGCVATAVTALSLAPIPAFPSPSDTARNAEHAPTATRAATPSTTVTIGHNAMSTGYSASRYALAEGGRLLVTNHDTVTHTVTSVARTRQGNALFDTVVAPGSTAVVSGVTALPSGRYAFYCRIHPSMRSTLMIGSGIGSPHPRKITFAQP